MSNQLNLSQNPQPIFGIPNNITLTPTTLLEQILSQNIMQLQKENTDLRAKIGTFIQNENILRETIKGNEQTIDALRKENEELKKKLKELEDKFNILETDHNILKSGFQELNNKYIDIMAEIDVLKSRDNPITVREAFITLESHIKVKITGSKRKARSIGDIQSLFNNPDYKQDCDNFLNEHCITKDHIYLFATLKEKGNRATHADRTIKREDLDDLAESMLPIPIDPEDVVMTHDLLKVLDKIVPINKDGTWNIENPL